MKSVPLILLLLIGCGSQVQDPSHPHTSAPAASPAVQQAAPVQQYGHLFPIQLPPGEFFDGFLTVPSVWVGTNSGSSQMQPEKYFFTTTTHPAHDTCGTHVLRDSQGVPVLIVKDWGLQ